MHRSSVKRIDKDCITRAIELAKEAWGETHPNPMVGALIVEDGEVVSEGYHLKSGERHAEIAALENLSRSPRPNATLYVTMEPCSTKGRTGACVEAIIKAGLSRVVIGSRDPNPLHNGKGLKMLYDAGVDVVEIGGSLCDECMDMNLIFNHWIKHEQPFFALKLAVTANGKIAARNGEPSSITGALARADVMNWRRLFPAIAVGAGTVSSDNPRLTARCNPDEEWCPRRIILDGGLSSVPAEGELPRVYSDEFRERTCVVTGNGNLPADRRERLIENGINLFSLPLDADGRFSYADLRELAMSEGWTGVYFEGGAGVARQMRSEKSADYLFWYESPKVFDSLESLDVPPLSAFPMVANAKHLKFGLDSCVRGHLNFPR